MRNEESNFDDPACISGNSDDNRNGSKPVDVIAAPVQQRINQTQGEIRRK